MKLSDIARQIGATLHPKEHPFQEREILAIRPIDKAGPNDLTFQTNPRYASKISATKAAAIILESPSEKTRIPQIIHKNPYAAMAKAAQLFYTPSHSFQGRSELAFIHPEASVNPTATVYPFAFIDKGAKIEAGAIIYPHSYIGPRVTIGHSTVLYSGVSVMHDCKVGDHCIIHSGCIIGADGFGFAPDNGREPIKIPQTARAIIENHVELQAGCTIDRGALKDTIIGEGSKLDDQVLVAHGVQIGKNCLIAGQGAIAGSSKIGDRFMMAGCGAIGPSLTIASDVLIGPKAGVNAPIDKPGEYHGFPLVPATQWRKETISLKKLPELLKRVRSLELQLEKLTRDTSP